MTCRQDSKESKDDDRVQKDENIIEDTETWDESNVSSSSTNSQQDALEVDVSKETEHKLLPSDILDWAPLQG